MTLFLGGSNSHIFYVHPKILGEDEANLTFAQIFQMGGKKPPSRYQNVRKVLSFLFCQFTTQLSGLLHDTKGLNVVSETRRSSQLNEKTLRGWVLYGMNNYPVLYRD